MTPEQVAQNAFIGNLVGQGIHIFIMILVSIEGYVLMRYRQENQRQQEQIDSCYLRLASIAETLDVIDKKLDETREIKTGD